MEDKESRADFRYYPANAAKPLVEVVGRMLRTQEDRELVAKSIDRMIDENEHGTNTQSS